MVHAYPSMEHSTEPRDVHDSSVLFSALALSGDVVVTGTGDEYFEFWKVWVGRKWGVGVLGRDQGKNG
jgi:hypothetical protein